MLEFVLELEIPKKPLWLIFEVFLLLFNFLERILMEYIESENSSDLKLKVDTILPIKIISIQKKIQKSSNNF